jgi:predicted nucleotidyltransferase
MSQPATKFQPRVLEIGEMEMDIVQNQTGISYEPQVTDQPLFLWVKQNYRKLLGKPMLQEEVLEKVVAQAIQDENLLAILLFGSLASGTHTWKSDIDLIFVYQDCEPSSGVANIFVEGVVVQYFFTSYEMLVQSQKEVPYLLHMFCDGKILFDRHESIAPVLDQLRQYFGRHPEIEADWIRFKDLHQVEKNGPACAQTTIFQRWDELQAKYSDGVQERTFFRM